MGERMRGARVFVTGGAGLVGSHIVDLCLEAGAARVTVLDTFERGRHENLAAAEASGRLAIVEGDIRDAALVDEHTASADFVFHQAALRITQCAEEPLRAVDVLVRGTQIVIEAAVRHRVKKLVAASSASVYGEPSSVPIDESHAFNNRTIYGAGKIADEQLLRAYAEMSGLRYVALRYFNIYGPRMDLHGVYTEVLPRWLALADQGQAPVIHGDGYQSVDLVYVGDVARANLLAAESDASDVALNIGSGREATLRELCRLVLELSGHPELEPRFEPERKVNPVRRRLAAIARARTVLGYEPLVDLETGLKALIAWRRGGGA